MKHLYSKGIASICNSLKIAALAILGTISTFNSNAQTYATVPFVDGFETGTMGTSWTIYSSLATNGILPIQTGTLTWSTQTAYSHTGNYFLGMHYPTGGSYNLNQANLHMNLAGESDLRLDFWWAEWNDESEVEDGIFISDDNGANYVKVLDLPGANYADLVYTHFVLNLDSINTVHGLTFTSQYIVRFQQYDNYYFAGGNDGFLFDDIQIYNICGTSSTLSPTVCSTYTVPSGNQTYTTSGTYVDTLVNSVGCDSLITINLTVNSTASSITESVCGSYTAPDGMSYTTSGMYTAVIPNSLGCDSTITIDLEILSPSSSSIVATECGSYTAPDGMSYTSSGMYSATIANAAGCDSTISIDLTINPIVTTNITESACNDYMAPDSTIYTTSGIYTAYLMSSSGCDSTVVIDLTINTASSSTITETALDTYTVPSGNQTYTTSGTYMDTIANANGCDSVITINLTMQYTSLNELQTKLIQAFPNPTSGVVQLDGIDALTGIASIELLDSRGRLVAKIETEATSLNLEAYEAGTYMIIVRHDKGTERLPIIKR